MSLSSCRGAPVTTESRPTGPGSVPETEAATEVRYLRKIYRATVAVDDVSPSVRDGEIFGILGPNGAGKTTTVECVIGLRCPEAGDIRVMGLDPQADREDLHMIVGAQLQASALPAQLEVGEILDLYHSFYAEAADLAETMDSLGLAEKRNARYRSLSGGLKQRLSIAQALIGNPKVAVLDEMTTGLDPQARCDTWQHIEQVRDRGVTISLVTHYRPRAGFWQRHRGEGTGQLGSDWFSESKPTRMTCADAGRTRAFSVIFGQATERTGAIARWLEWYGKDRAVVDVPAWRGTESFSEYAFSWGESSCGPHLFKSCLPARSGTK